MDLWQLHVFCRVVEQKSFSRAGVVVHLSQPTVSSHIRDLEDHFGCRLIDRLAREAVPTGAGKVLYKYANRLLRLRDQTESAMSEYLGRMKGRLNIGGSTIPGGYLLPGVIGGFKADYPEVTISLMVGDTEKIVGEVIAGAVEIGVVGARTSDRRLIQEQLAEDEMRLIVPGDHPWGNRRSVTLEMLLSQPFILRESGSGTLKSLQICLLEEGYHLQDFHVVSEMGSTAAVIQGIKSRLGVSILSKISVLDELETGALKALKVKGLKLDRGFYLICHRQRSLSPLATAFLAFIKSRFPESNYS
jgi:DNA-binding transcriptional LysR family regulator